MDVIENAPQLWQDQWNWPDAASHKYSRGSTLVFGGSMTGAARLAARAAQRIGAGIVHVSTQPPLAAVYSQSLTSCIIRTDGLRAALADGRLGATLIGPGLEPDNETRAMVRAVLMTFKPVVLDAGALTAFANDRNGLHGVLHAKAVLTPHEGEFARLFSTEGDRMEQARRAAAGSGAIIVLKGAETLIAAPDGSVIVNRNAPPDLATAGSGDVLAGFITGLLAQGLPPSQAAAAGVWVQSEAARRFGPGLIAEDIEMQVPAILRDLKAEQG